MKAEAHKHQWERIDESLPQEVCRCGYIKIDELLIGKNSITLSPSAIDVVRWSESEVGTSVGDIGMNTTTGRPQFNVSGTGNVSGSVQGDHSGAAWGLAYFGSGTDGSLTLVSNTTLASLENIKHYTTLDLAGFTLNNTNGDLGLSIHVSGSIKGDGTIQGRRNSFDGFDGSNSGSQPGGGGTQTSGGFCHVFANTLESGTYTFTSRSSNGGNGGNGLTPTTTTNGSNGGNGATSAIISGRIEPVGAAGAGGGGQSNGTAGTGGSGGAGYSLRAFKDILKFISPGGTGIGENDFYNRTWRGPSGASGGRGGANNGGTQAAGGGGGAAGNAYISSAANGGNGGAGGAGLAGTSGTGGGGGGGGSSSGIVLSMVAYNSATSLNLNAIGGTGGNGGNGDVANAGRGGGGAGGGGGIVIYIGASGDPRTLSAAGGSGGTAGTGTGNGGSAGSTGVSGVTYDLTR